MKLNAQIGDKQRTVEIRDSAGVIDILIDGESKEMVVSEPEPGTFLFKTSDGVFEAFVTQGPDGSFEVEVDGNELNVAVSDPKRLTHTGIGAGGSEGLSEIKSAMPGKVVKLLVSVGDEVLAGAGVIVVEAMKMQNELKSPKEGTVIGVHVAEDERVNSGDLLVVIE